MTANILLGNNDENAMREEFIEMFDAQTPSVTIHDYPKIINMLQSEYNKSGMIELKLAAQTFEILKYLNENKIITANSVIQYCMINLFDRMGDNYSALMNAIKQASAITESEVQDLGKNVEGASAQNLGQMIQCSTLGIGSVVYVVFHNAFNNEEDKNRIVLILNNLSWVSQRCIQFKYSPSCLTGGIKQSDQVVYAYVNYVTSVEDIEALSLINTRGKLYTECIDENIDPIELHMVIVKMKNIKAATQLLSLDKVLAINDETKTLLNDNKQIEMLLGPLIRE